MNRNQDNRSSIMRLPGRSSMGVLLVVVSLQLCVGMLLIFASTAPVLLLLYFGVLNLSCCAIILWKSSGNSRLR
jgi:hypothetical protein